MTWAVVAAGVIAVGGGVYQAGEAKKAKKKDKDELIGQEELKSSEMAAGEKSAALDEIAKKKAARQSSLLGAAQFSGYKPGGGKSLGGI